MQENFSSVSSLSFSLNCHYSYRCSTSTDTVRCRILVSPESASIYSTSTLADTFMDDDQLELIERPNPVVSTSSYNPAAAYHPSHLLSPSSIITLQCTRHLEAQPSILQIISHKLHTSRCLLPHIRWRAVNIRKKRFFVLVFSFFSPAPSCCFDMVYVIEKRVFTFFLFFKNALLNGVIEHDTRRDVWSIL